MPISVLVLTLNEERNLGACLDAVRWSDDIVVFDSFSSDKTTAVAKAYGARVIQRRFDNERDHRLAALQTTFKYPWVFNPDADEIADPELIDEMLAVARRSPPESAFRLRRKDMFMGHWIRHSSLYPTWLVRFFRPQSIRYGREINLDTYVDGPVGYLNGHLIHHSFNKGLEAWVEKHNRYSSAEAIETIASRAVPGLPWKSLFARDPVVRRRALKAISFRLPMRPLLRFLYMYLGRLGILDGTAGYTYCRLLAIYEYLIVLKAREALVAAGHSRQPAIPMWRKRA